MEEYENLIEHLKLIPDMRAERGKKHKLIDILFIALCSIISDGEGIGDIVNFAEHREKWLRKYIELPYGIPSYCTFRRVLQILEPKDLQKGLMSWTESLRNATSGQVIALDGKTLRHSFDTWSGQKSLHLLNAWVTDNGIAIGCERVGEKSNEIPAAPDLIEKLSVKGHIVTLDAMGCQKETAKKIIEKGGDYLLCAKKNQPSLYEDLKEFFDDCGDFKTVDFGYYENLEKGHGRIEERKCWAVEGESKWLGLDKEWKKIRTLAMIKRKRTIRETSSEETSYYITSLEGNARKIAEAARSHWAIENSLHWVLDVTMNEDMNRIRKDNAPENMAVMRRVAISMVNQIKGKLSVRRALKSAAMDTDFLEKILVGHRQL